ncbi:hypothetical protein ACUTQ5_06365 [Serratia sp. NA_112.1]|uniref:hypothetical protein n=1 Tax=unclassified Serratia (in: enterobacteria) TaxID=2647522 RepID=UPI004046F3A8
MKLNVWTKVKSLFFSLIHTLVPVLTGGLAVLAWVMFIDDSFWKYVAPISILILGTLVAFFTPDSKSQKKNDR